MSFKPQSKPLWYRDVFGQSIPAHFKPNIRHHIHMEYGWIEIFDRKTTTREWYKKYGKHHLRKAYSEVFQWGYIAGYSPENVLYSTKKKKWFVSRIRGRPAGKLP